MLVAKRPEKRDVHACLAARKLVTWDLGPLGSAVSIDC